MPPPQVQQTVGEDVTAVQVCGELYLVDGKKGDIGIRWHGFHSADTKARAGRQYLLLAGNQRDILHTDLGHHAAIDLARQQTQRQADHTGRLGHHALDGHMGLARIGRP